MNTSASCDITKDHTTSAKRCGHIPGPKKCTSLLSVANQAQQSISSREEQKLQLLFFLKLHQFSWYRRYLITIWKRIQSEPDCVPCCTAHSARLRAFGVDLEVRAHQCKTEEEAAAQSQRRGTTAPPPHLWIYKAKLHGSDKVKPLSTFALPASLGVCVVMSFLLLRLCARLMTKIIRCDFWLKVLAKYEAI